MASSAQRSTILLLTATVLFGAGACVEPHCPKGYDERGDTCYRIRDAGADGGDAADGGGVSPILGDTGAEDAPTLTSGCGDGCGAHASCDAESRECKCDPGYVEDGANCVRDPCAQALACGEHQVCEVENAAATCTCAEGYDQCGDVCADLDSDAQHCGRCGHPCETGRCDAGKCVQCDSAAECADKTCQMKSCASGRCVYADVPPGQTGSCASKLVCTADRECKECASDAQCEHLDGMCADGVCDPSSHTCQAKAKSGSCGNLKICSGMSCADSCGNGVVDAAAGEECDPKATAAGWDDWSCNSETCRRTGLSSSTSYHQCASDAECTPAETCKPTFAQPVFPLCIPKCYWGACPFPPGYKSVIATDRQATLCDDARGYECWIDCATNDDCPPGVPCVGGGICAAYD